MKHSGLFLLLPVFLLVLGGTLSHAQVPALTLDERWAATRSAGIVDDTWLKDFRDPVLEALASELLGYNVSLADTNKRIGHASSHARNTLGYLTPAIDDLFANIQIPAISAGSRAAGVSLNTNRERLLWFRLGLARASEQADHDLTAGELAFARTSLLGQLSKAWLLAVETHTQLALAREAVELHEQLDQHIRRLPMADKLSPAIAQLAKNDLAYARNRLRYSDGAYFQAVRSLETMLGRNPTAQLDDTHRSAPDLAPLPAEMPVAVAPGDPIARQALASLTERYSNELTLAGQEDLLARQVEADARALAIAHSNYGGGQMDHVGLLKMKIRHLHSRIRLTHLRHARMQQRADLYIEMGGMPVGP